MELVLRQVQRVEYLYSHCSHGPAAASGGRGGRAHAKKQALGIGRVGYLMDESAAFMGMARGRGEIMVCPELLDCVAKEVERDAGVLKQIRKAREGGALIGTKAPGGGGGNE